MCCNLFRGIATCFLLKPKIAILLHFCFPWGRPWRNHAKCCMDRKRIWCLQIASLHLTITVSEIERDIGENNGRKAGFFIPPLHSTPPLGGFTSEYRHPLWYGKTRMVSLLNGEKISKICLFVLTWSTNVTDRQTDRQTLHDRKDRAYASHGAVKNMQLYF